MTKPSIAVLVTSNARRGAEVFGSQLVAGLADRGWRANLLALGLAPEGAATIDAEVIGRSVSGLNRGVLSALRSRLRADRPDAILANGGATLRYAVVSTTLLRRRPYLVYGSIGEPMYWVRSTAHLRMLRAQLARCDAVFAVSEATRRQLVEQVGVAGERVEVASTGVDPSWSRLRTDPGSAPFRMVWIGSLSSEKDPLLAREAFGRARLTAGAELRFVGDGPLRARIDDAAPPGVVCVGSVSDIRPHLEWARCLVLSSRTEGLPGVALEALGSGLPVIATRVGGVSDVVVDGESGLTVPHGDADALARAMERLDVDPDLRSTMGSAGKKLITGGYLFEHSFDRYDALLRRRLQEGAP